MLAGCLVTWLIPNQGRVNLANQGHLSRFDHSIFLCYDGVPVYLTVYLSIAFSVLYHAQLLHQQLCSKSPDKHSSLKCNKPPRLDVILVICYEKNHGQSQFTKIAQNTITQIIKMNILQHKNFQMYNILPLSVMCLCTVPKVYCYPHSW